MGYREAEGEDKIICDMDCRRTTSDLMWNEINMDGAPERFCE